MARSSAPRNPVFAPRKGAILVHSAASGGIPRFFWLHLPWGAPAAGALQRAHRGNENLRPLLVVAEHVEAGARRRQQHGVTGLRQLAGTAYRIVHVACAFDGDADCCTDGLFDQRPVAAEQNHGACMASHRRFQRRKILPLAIPAKDDHDLAILRIARRR